jgi:hypothetical protein
MGRIVVVGYEPTDEEVVLDAFRWLRIEISGGSSGEPATESLSSSLRVRGSELEYVRATDDLVISKFIEVNMPRAALAGLRRALEGTDPAWTRRWLGEERSGGEPAAWKYVYLTEPDTILQTRPSSIRSIRAALDGGHIVIPHRLQPIPHRDDAALSRAPHLVMSSFKAPAVLESGDAETGRDGSQSIRASWSAEPLGACCDAQEGDYKPGKSGMGHCGHFWWECGFADGNHSRLSAYELVRLSRGTGVATLAGSEHGRRCVPAPAGSCRVAASQPEAAAA